MQTISCIIKCFLVSSRTRVCSLVRNGSAVGGGIVSEGIKKSLPAKSMQSFAKCFIMYNVIVIGGTFDHLHEGHKVFLRFAFQKSKEVLIGVTADEYAETH